MKTESHAGLVSALASSAQSMVGIEFKVFCPTFNRVTHRLFLLGSLQELGTWSIFEAVEAFPTPDTHTWKADISVPAHSSFEWVWLKTQPNRTLVEWERPVKRNRTVDCCSGTLHTIWGEEEEVFHQAATCVELITFIQVEDGYTLVLSGSTPNTGLWNMKDAQPATEFPKRSGYWKIHVVFDAATYLDFKWAIVKEKNYTKVRVSEKAAHSVYGRRSWMRAVAPWMLPTMIVVETPLVCDTVDSLRGRTDVIVMQRKRRLEEIRRWLGTQPTSEKPIAANISRVSSADRWSANEAMDSDSSKPSTDTKTDTSRPDTKRTVQAEENVKGREGISKSARLANQLNKDFTSASGISTIKGKGQVESTTDMVSLECASALERIPEGEAHAFGRLTSSKTDTGRLDALLGPTTKSTRSNHSSSPVAAKTAMERVSASQTGRRKESAPQKEPGLTMVLPGSVEEREGRTILRDCTDARRDDKLLDCLESDSRSSQREDAAVTAVDKMIRGVRRDSASCCSLGLSVSSGVQEDRSQDEFSWISCDESGTAQPSSISVLGDLEVEKSVAHDPDSGFNELESVCESKEEITLPEAGKQEPEAAKESLRQDLALACWECLQADLSPPCTGAMGDARRLAAGSFPAKAEDEYMDWLEHRVKREDDYCNMITGVESSLSRDQPKLSLFQVALGSDGSARHGRSGGGRGGGGGGWGRGRAVGPRRQAEAADTTAPKPSANISPHSAYTVDGEDSGTHYVEGDASWRLCRQHGDVDTDVETLKRRRIARFMEEQWGDAAVTPSRRASGRGKLSLSAALTAGLYTTAERTSGGWGVEKVWLGGEYTCQELIGTLARAPSRQVDHRARAREMERLWGDRARNRSRTLASRPLVGSL